MFLWIMLACDPTQAPDKAGAGDSAGPSSTTSVDSGETGDTGEEAREPLVCPLPASCIDPSEATDRGLGFFYMSDGGTLEFQDDGADICMERWYTLLGTGTQDAIAGFRETTRMSAGNHYTMEYGHDVYGSTYRPPNGGWWCIEHNQYTQAQADFDFIGQQAPPSLYELVLNRADRDGDGTEDHVGITDGQYQAQWTIWDRIAEEPVDIIGRRPNYLALRAGETGTVTIEATDIGRKFSYGSITETVPAGLVASDFSVAPARTVVNGDGSTTYWWAAKLQAAEDGASEYVPSVYYPARISYSVTMQSCQGRIVGPPPTVRWNESDGSEWTSYGSELIAECCPG